MLRTVAPNVLLLACGLALAGCGGSASRSDTGPGDNRTIVVANGADAFIPQLNSFTEELLAKVEQAPDTKAGVAAAQALLDARKEGLVKSIGALKQDARARAPLLEAEVDNTDRVYRLQLKYADAAARDAELKARLERLIGDYDALFR
jgi:hypothetical protein